jgi:hypothetical protein
MANSKGRRKRKRLLQEQGLSVPLKSPVKRQSPQPSISLWRRTLRWVTGAGTFVGLVIAIFGAYPWLSLQEGGFLQPNNGLSEMWILENTGYIPITNLDASCGLNVHFSDSDTVRADLHDMTFTYLKFAEYLGHSRTVTIPCFQSTDIAGGLYLATGSNLDVAIRYSYYHLNFAALRRTQKFHFVSIVGPDRVQHWVHR